MPLPGERTVTGQGASVDPKFSHDEWPPSRFVRVVELPAEAVASTRRSSRAAVVSSIALTVLAIASVAHAVIAWELLQDSQRTNAAVMLAMARLERR